MICILKRQCKNTVQTVWAAVFPAGLSNLLTSHKQRDEDHHAKVQVYAFTHNIDLPNDPHRA